MIASFSRVACPLCVCSRFARSFRVRVSRVRLAAPLRGSVPRLRFLCVRVSVSRVRFAFPFRAFVSWVRRALWCHVFVSLLVSSFRFAALSLGVVSCRCSAFGFRAFASCSRSALFAPRFPRRAFRAALSVPRFSRRAFRVTLLVRVFVSPSRVVAPRDLLTRQFRVFVSRVRFACSRCVSVSLFRFASSCCALASRFPLRVFNRRLRFTCSFYVFFSCLLKERVALGGGLARSAVEEPNAWFQF